MDRSVGTVDCTGRTAATPTRSGSQLLACPRPGKPGPEAARDVAEELTAAAHRVYPAMVPPAAAALVTALVAEPHRATTWDEEAAARFAAAVVDAAGSVYWCRTVLHPVGECAFGSPAHRRCGLVLDAAHELGHR